MMRYLGNLLLLIVFFSIINCSVYTFNPHGKLTINSIAVERFENETAEYGLSDQISDEIIDAFIADGTFKILPVDDAEAILYGKLLKYNRSPQTYDQNDEVLEYKVEMDFDITLKNPKDDKEIWSERMNQIGIYDVSFETEKVGQQRVIKLLIESIINKTTKSW